MSLSASTDKGKVILHRMQADIRAQKAIQRTSHSSAFVESFNAPIKRTTTAACLRKAAQEAVMARSKIPPEFRASPYGQKGSKAVMPSGLSREWDKKEERIPQNPAPAPTMAAKFNQAAKADGKAPLNTPAPKPEQ